MTTVITEAELPTIEVFSEDFERDPLGVYAVYRERHWIARCELGYIVLAYDATSQLMKDRRLISPGEQLVQLLGAREGSPTHRWFTNNVANNEGERHARLRRLMTPAFTPRRADESRGMIREIFNEALEPHLANGSFDLVGDVAANYPIRVLSRLIGIDEADIPKFKGWIAKLMHGYDMKPEFVPMLNETIAGMWEELSRIVAERIASGVRRDDLLQALIEASQDGDRLSNDELISMLIMSLVAGVDTSKNQLCNTMYGLVSRPEQWARLASDPALVPKAVEEGLRFRPASGAVPRLVVEDLEYRGLSIPAGAWLQLPPPAANRDPATFPEPDKFDIDREGESHLAFGFGHHFCVGAHLARAELQIGLDVLVKRIANPQITGPVTWTSPFGAWGPETLPMSFDVLGS